MEPSSALLVAHAITKFGSKGWEFATPLLLLHFSPDGSLFAPTLFGLVIFMLKFLLGPAAGLWMDRSPRLEVIRSGVALQALGVCASLLVYGLLCWAQANSVLTPGLHWLLILGMVLCGVVEALGALISSVAVKKDWVPTIWDAVQEKDTLATINAWMANIDLVAEIFGPLAAGFALYACGDGAGFVLVGLTNAASFAVELVLLIEVYRANTKLSAPKPDTSGRGGGKSRLSDLLEAWPLFVSQPSGIPLLVTSYSLLYLTVLSPHGVVLTAYLQTRGVDAPALASFRALGALAGVAGMAAFRIFSARVGLRPLASVHLWILAVSVAAAAASFYATHGQPGVTHPMAVFLGLVCVSRFGLYGFDLANIQLQQLHVDEAMRNSVGAVESSLCSLGTALVFVGTLATSSHPVGGTGASGVDADDAAAQPHPFDVLVYLSALFVGSSAVVYSLWCCMFHEHEHAHPLFESAAPSHKHTAQQQRTLEESDNRTHTHLHFAPPSLRGFLRWGYRKLFGSSSIASSAASEHEHEHEHGHGHSHSHS